MLSKTLLLNFLVFCRRWFIGLVAAYVFASSAFGGTKSAKPVFHLLAGGWTAGLIVHHWRLRRNGDVRPGSRSASVTRTLEIIGFNLALALVLGEWSIRLSSAVTGNSLLISDAVDAHKLVPGHDYGFGLRGNRLGFAGHDFEKEKRPGVFRIAALGDSFVVGPAVAFQDNFLTLLEGDLPGTEVYNFGVSGAGPREYRAVLRKDVWPFQPDLVLVCVFLGNDITESLPLPRYLDLRGHSLYLFVTRSWRLLEERWNLPESATAAGHNGMAGPALSESSYWAIESRRLEVCLDPLSATMEKKWRQALGYLDGMVRDCQAHRTPVAFLLIPDEFQVDSAVLEKALAARGVKREDLDLDLPQRRLGFFCSEREVRYLDLKPIFQQECQSYAPFDTHWNEKGNHLATRCLAPWLRELIEYRRWRIEERESRREDR